MISERLKLMRSECKLTQAALAAELGIAKTTLASYEQGKNEPSIEMLIKIANYFEVSVDYLIGKSDCENPENEKITKDLGLTEDAIYLLEDLNSISKEQGFGDILTIFNKMIVHPNFLELMTNLSIYSKYTEQNWKTFSYDLLMNIEKGSGIKPKFSTAHLKNYIMTDLMQEFQKIIDDIIFISSEPPTPE